MKNCLQSNTFVIQFENSENQLAKTSMFFPFPNRSYSIQKTKAEFTRTGKKNKTENFVQSNTLSVYRSIHLLYINFHYTIYS